MTGLLARASMDGMSTASYVRDLDAALVGPRRAKRGLLREAGDHLEDATEAYRAAGYDDASAQEMAVADFGTVDELAPSFQTTLAVASSRRTAWMLLGVLGIQPFVWDGDLAPLAPDEPGPEGLLYAALDIGVEVVGGLAIAAAVLLVLASGIGNRWFRAGRPLARLVGTVTIGAVVVIQLTGISLMLLGGGLGPVPLLMLVTFILVPMNLTAVCARRTLATC